MYSALQFAFMLLDVAGDRVRALRADDERELGASALEWAVISAIVITAAVLIGGVIYSVVRNKGTSITNCGNAGASAQNC